MWRRHEPDIARMRYRAAVQAFDRARAAWQTDQVIVFKSWYPSTFSALIYVMPWHM